ncbi:serine/threonine-protein kinase [Spirillospora sp. CA-294931]|uniref:serine/threonine-protein kinase n=1 Tax=Spirillospora sp. CA-294931 TaxID=3240042 RepID=UPI003D90FBF0
MRGAVSPMEVGALRSGDPERLGTYALIGRVGEGGQGTVFLGEGPDGRQVAVKLLHSELTSDDKARARFLRELETAKAVAPFCTAQVIDAEADGDRPYIVSEYVPGPSLNQLVLQDGPLSGASLERLAVGTATALAAIHQAKIIHRDFKPHNVLIGSDGPRVIDFGVARAISGNTTLTSKVIGTPSYMAPEMLQGEEVGTAADVFCWAATLVFAATGKPPFGQDTIPAVINRVLHSEPELGSALDGALRDLVLNCLDKDPSRRPNARQVLMRLLGHEEAAAPAAPAAEPSASDETAILAAGSVKAAELGADEPYADRTFVDGGGTPPLPVPIPDVVPGDWGAQDTIAPHRPARRGGSVKTALIAVAAALAVAGVITGAALAFGDGDKGKRGETVSDRNPPSTSISVEPSEPSPTESDTDDPEPSDEPEPTPTPTPTTTTPSPDPTTPSPDPTTPSPDPTTPSPDPTTPSPDPTTTKPTEPATSAAG